MYITFKNHKKIRRRYTGPKKLIFYVVLFTLSLLHAKFKFSLVRSMTVDKYTYTCIPCIMYIHALPHACR